MCDKPVATFWGWMPNGVKTNVPVPLDGTPDDFDRILNYQNMFLSRGFVLDDPAYGKLEAGEKTDSVGYVVRYDKENKHGGISHWIGLYPASDEATKKYLWVYLDTPENIADFEQATGIKVTSMKVWPTNQAPERTPSTMEFIVKVKQVTTVVYKINPDWSEDPKDKFVPKRIFVRWATQPTPLPPPAAAAQAAEPAKAAPQRNARLENEELVITRVVKTGMITGNPDPAKNGFKYDGWGKIVDGGTFDVRVWIYPEDVTKILDAGYGFNESSDNHIPIIMDTTDRAMTRIGQVVPKDTGDADLGALGTENGHSDETVNSFITNKLQSGKPVLIFKYGDNYAYSYTREPFRLAGYNVDGWDVVGNHEMPTPAKLTCKWDKQHKQLIVDKADMLDVFAEAS